MFLPFVAVHPVCAGDSFIRNFGDCRAGWLEANRAGWNEVPWWGGVSPCIASACRQREGGQTADLTRSLLVYLLNVQGCLCMTADVVADHLAGEFVAVDQDDTFSQMLGGLTGCRR